MKTQIEWIPVGTKAPALGKRVLLSRITDPRVDDFTIQLGHARRWRGMGLTWIDEWGRIITDSVTAWAELPEPYVAPKEQPQMTRRDFLRGMLFWRK